MSIFHKYLNLFVNLQHKTAILLLVAIIVSNIAEIVVRVITGSSLMFNQELTVIFCIWSVFLGWSAICHQNKDLAVDLINIILPANLLPYLRMLLSIVIFIFMGVLAYSAGRLAIYHMGEYSDVVQIPMELYSVPIMISAISIALSSIMHFVDSLNNSAELNSGHY